MVNGTKRFGFASGSGGDDTTLARLPGAGKECPKHVRGDTRHIAGHNQVPVRRGYAQGGVDASQWSTAGKFVPIDRIAEAGISNRLTNQSDGTGGLLDKLRQVLDQRGSTIREQGFVPAHPGAAAAGQHESRPLHERIIALAVRGVPRDPRLRIGEFRL